MRFYLFFANIYSIITVNPLWNLCIYNKRWKRHEERERLYEEKEVIVGRAGRNLCRVHAGRLRIGGASGCNGDHAGRCTGDGQDERNGKTESVGRGINV